MITPDTNYRMVEALLHRPQPTRPTYRQAGRPDPKERRQPMALTIRYARYVLSSLATVAFGMTWN
ncbi:MAG: hypothetical protein ACK2T6_08320 [Anaerolineae bacterium]